MMRQAHAHIRLDIQGLRAIAVGAVVLFHAFPSLLPGGFVGVDIFFVISGYLISGILYREITTHRFSMMMFYRKRIRRIFPALFIVLIATLACGAILLPPASFMALARNTISTSLFVSNVDFYLSSGYFDSAAELRPLLHTWSLSVEEQFYIVFPLILVILIGRAPALLIPAIILAFTVALGLSEWGAGRSPTGAYFLSPFRAFEFLIGSFASLVKAPASLQQKGFSDTLSILGAALIAGSLLALTPDSRFPGIHALPPTIGAGLILFAGSVRETAAGRVLSLTPIVYIGSISYSFYLWHWPVLSYLRIFLQPDHPGPIALSCAVLLSLSLSALSYHLIEQRYSRLSLESAPIIRGGMLAMTVAILSASIVIWAGGFAQRFTPAANLAFTAAMDFSPIRSGCHREGGQIIEYSKTCVIGAAEPPDIAVWGDSHGAEMAYVLGKALEPMGRSVRQITASGCPPAINVNFPARDDCSPRNAEILQQLTADTTIQQVILFVNAENYIQLTPEAELEQGYAAVVRSLASAGKTLILVSQIPNPGFEAPEVAGMLIEQGRDPTQYGRYVSDMNASTGAWQRFVTNLGDRYMLPVVLPEERLCNPRLCPIAGRDQQIWYFNPTHLSIAGAKQLLPAVLNAMCAGSNPHPACVSH